MQLATEGFVDGRPMTVLELVEGVRSHRFGARDLQAIVMLISSPLLPRVQSAHHCDLVDRSLASSGRALTKMEQEYIAHAVDQFLRSLQTPGSGSGAGAGGRGADAEGSCTTEAGPGRSARSGEDGDAHAAAPAGAAALVGPNTEPRVRVGEQGGGEHTGDAGDGGACGVEQVETSPKLLDNGAEKDCSADGGGEGGRRDDAGATSSFSERLGAGIQAPRARL